MSNDTVGVLGGTGFLGSHIINKLITHNIRYISGSRRTGVDARSLDSLLEWIRNNKITQLINLAAECGGIGLNKFKPADLWLSTTQISTTVFEAARIVQLNKIIQLGTVCSYAKYCPVPFQEGDLLHHGYPEETNSGYGIAKLNALFGATAYRQQYGLNIIYLIPVNLYGPMDNFNPESAHVIPMLIKKCVDAVNNNIDSIECWGTGTASREFLYVEDAAEAIILALKFYNGVDPINVGVGNEISIKNLIEMIAELSGFTGKIRFNPSYPDGQPRRRLDVSRANTLLGFTAQTKLKEGLRKTLQWYRESLDKKS